MVKIPVGHKSIMRKGQKGAPVWKHASFMVESGFEPALLATQVSPPMIETGAEAPNLPLALDFLKVALSKLLSVAWFPTCEMGIRSVLPR